MGVKALAVAAIFAASIVNIQPAVAQVQSTWERIQENGVVRIGCINAEPFGFKDPGTDEWSGIGPGFGALIAEDLQVEWECVETTWGTAIAGLQADQFDLAPGFDPTPQRALAIDFPKGVLIFYAVAVLAQDGVNAENWSDLNDSSINVAVPLGTSNDVSMTAILDKANFTRTQTSPEAIAAFASGRADVVGGSTMWLAMQQHAVGSGRVVVPKPVQAAIAGIGIRKEDDKRWRDWLSVALEYYYWRGSMVKVYQDYMRSRGIDPNEAPPIRIEDMMQK